MRNVNLFMLIQDYFQKHLIEERGLSPNTVLSYRDATKDFLRYVCRVESVTALKLEPQMLHADTLRDYLASLEKSRGLSIRTRNQRLAAIKTLLRYLGANDLGHIAVYQRAAMVEIKRRASKTIDYLVDHEMKAMLTAAAKANHRHHLLLALLYNTGARVQEICDLKFKDVVLGPPPSIYLTGKGNKQRQVPIWPATAEILRTELAAKESEPDLERHVILNAKEEPMTRFGALHVIKKLAKEAAVACPTIKRKKISPHVLRHTTAMHLLQSGIDLSVIKMWLGHVNINTTHDYVELDIEMKREALQKSKKLKPAPSLKIVLEKHKDVIAWLESL